MPQKGSRAKRAILHTRSPILILSVNGKMKTIHSNTNNIKLAFRFLKEQRQNKLEPERVHEGFAGCHKRDQQREFLHMTVSNLALNIHPFDCYHIV
jgi:hypothetical protein